ncbi:hypothetical protein ACFWVC_17175 [Streptomyces sp. NPDC058691]|uniref:hypothetical protein n=1 Tax=Streptomyces sp. NPDC058691 TaxID=3346601 RepID=UPI003655816F
MTSGPAFRLARAAVFAAVCVTVTVLGHALMSRAVPGWAAGYAFAATTAGAWWPAGRRERGALAVTGATLVAQAALHGWFVLAQDFAAAPAGAGAVPVTGHHTSAVMGGMAASAPAMGGWSTGMALAHLVAALLCGWWLWRGEAAAFRLGRALAAFVFAPLRRAEHVLSACRMPVTVRPASFFAPVRAPHQASLWHTFSRRGPPEPAFRL